MIPHELREISPQVWSNGHIDFRPNRNAWDIVLTRNQAKPVAYIRWNSVWKEYVLFTRNGYIFAHDCLADITQLLCHLNATKGLK